MKKTLLTIINEEIEKYPTRDNDFLNDFDVNGMNKIYERFEKEHPEIYDKFEEDGYLLKATTPEALEYLKNLIITKTTLEHLRYII